MKNQLIRLVLLFCLLFPNISHSSSVETYPEKWLLLNYYHKKITGNYVSDIVNPEFFLHKNGRTSPSDEFAEFKKYLQAYIKDGSNAKEMCKFPARFSLFKETYSWMQNVHPPKCVGYEQANQIDNITSISLVLANGYFENPGSYYGHSLLKLNYGDARLNQKSVDASINYGANATDSPSSPMYLFKGLFGLYDATYTRNNDFIYTNAYTNLQMRDVWEYQLNLSRDEIKSLVEHNWEMSFAKFSYYFLSDNCAHRISNLIAFIKGRDAFKIHGFWLTPVQVTRKLQKLNLIEKVTYYPSLQTTLFKKYKAATSTDKNNFVKFLKLDNAAKQEMVPNLSANSLLMALDYLDLKSAEITTKTQDAGALAIINKQRAIILAQLYHRPPEQVKNHFHVPQPQSPSDAKATSNIRITYGHNSRDGGFAKLGYRATNNDLLNIPASGQEFSQFFMGNFELKKTENDDVKISKAVFAEVLNLDTDPMPISLTKKFSWQLKADYSAWSDICTDCSNFGIEGKIGKAQRLNDRFLFYALTGARIHTQDKNKESFVTQITDIGTIIKLSENLVFKPETSIGYRLQDGYADKLYKADLSYSPKGNFDYRIGVQNDGKQSVVMVGLGMYFD